MESSNSKRVLKNTLSLYVRTAVLTIVSLYTSRVVLASLGVDDYGIQNVVGGFVSMFGFISGTLSNATQRYFALDLAQGDWERVNKTYSINLVIYMAFILVILIISETVGLWFVLNVLNFDRARVIAAVVVYECAIISFLFMMFVTPYIALLTADENLSIYSAVSVFEAVLKLTAVFLLTIVNVDKLIFYSVAIAFMGISVNLFYYIYAKVKYKKLKFALCRDVSKYTDIFAFQGWNLIGAIASVLKAQGINIVINIFFGTAINAARGIAVTVNGAINSFASNFMKAVDPQITKAYGAGEQERFKKLIYTSSKMTFALLFIISAPVIYDAEYILSLWLGHVPDYAVIFVRLALIDAIIYSITDSIGTAVQSVGKIKIYQLVVGGMLLLNVPLSYFFLKINNNVLIPFYVAIILSIVGSIGRIICLAYIYSFNIMEYMRYVILPIILSTGIVIIGLSCIDVFASNFILLVRNVFCIMFVTGVLIYILVLDRDEKKFLLDIVRRKLNL